MKADDIATLRHRSFVYDPRPERFRNRPAYGDDFRNMVINFQVRAVIMYMMLDTDGVLSVLRVLAKS